MRSIPRERPIPREEPTDDVAPNEDPTTLRPPTFGEEAVSSTYEMLRESCRTEAAEPVDEELAIEAEILRVALDRSSQKPKT